MRLLGAALAALVAGSTAALLTAPAFARSADICGTLGLEPQAVRKSDGIVSETPHEEGTPVCEILTSKGKAYAAIYPKADAGALHASWELGIKFTIAPVYGYGAGAETLYTAGYAQEALGFYAGSHYLWLTTGGRYMHRELDSLATQLYGRFH
jgi:hypothetical protein